MPVEYEIHNVPLVGRNNAASRTPRLQPSVAAEYSDMLSSEVSRGEWSVDPDSGEPLNSKGQTPVEHLEFALSTRPHWLVPATVIDEADDTWTSGDLTQQGKRWKQLRAFLGNDKVTDAAIAAEAATYGAVPGSTKKGTKPGSKPAAGCKCCNTAFNCNCPDLLWFAHATPAREAFTIARETA